MSTTEYTEIEDLKIGDFAWALIYVHYNDIADLESNGRSTSDLKCGHPIRRLCLILDKPESGGVIVTYLASFNYEKTNSKALPPRFEDKSMWYPIIPAEQESDYEPILLNDPANGDERKPPQWISLRRRHLVLKAPLKRALFLTADLETVELIRGLMKA